MHIPDGFLSPTVSIAGYAATGGLTWYSLRQLKQQANSPEQIPKAALLTAAFFVISLIHVPIPPAASVHLVLNGLLGAILGYYAVPAILIGLFFQAVFFQHGGLSTLGVNSLIQVIPALFAYYLFGLRHYLGRKLPGTEICAFGAGFLGTSLAALLFAGLIVLTIPAELNAQIERLAVFSFLVSHLFLAFIEGGFSVMLISFLERVKPEVLESK